MTLTKSAAPSKDAERGVPIAESGPKFAGTDVAVENLFRRLDGGGSLDAFLKDFPAVSRAQAVAALRDEARAGMGAAVNVDPRIMDGAPVFRGTRLPVKSLFDYLADGYSLDDFLYQFPSASRERMRRALEAARQALEIYAYEDASPTHNPANPRPRLRR